jgi:hypothetical protein
MSLTQYITKKREKNFLTLQDLNIIKKEVDKLWKHYEHATRETVDLIESVKVWSEYSKMIDNMSYDIERVGVMFADVLPNRWPNEIIIGFSLCHTPIDQFDHIGDGGLDLFMRNYRQKKGLGRSIAFSRAVKWVEKTRANRISPEYYAQIIPASIRPDLKQFIQRAAKYYQDKELTEWAALFIGKES